MQISKALIIIEIGKRDFMIILIKKKSWHELIKALE